MKPVELLLTENVDNLGIVGDVVKVKPGYARNYLLPMQLATVPTPEAVEALQERRRQVEEEMKRLRAAQEKMIESLNEFELTLERSANEQGLLYGGVSQHDIAEGLRAEGFEVEDRHVRIGEQIKRLDSYLIPIVINSDLKTEIKLWVVSDQPLTAGEVEVEDGQDEENEETSVDALDKEGAESNNE